MHQERYFSAGYINIFSILLTWEQYFIDRKQGILYFYPPESLNLAGEVMGRLCLTSRKITFLFRLLCRWDEIYLQQLARRMSDLSCFLCTTVEELRLCYPTVQL